MKNIKSVFCSLGPKCGFLNPGVPSCDCVSSPCMVDSVDSCIRGLPLRCWLTDTKTVPEGNLLCGKKSFFCGKEKDALLPLLILQNSILHFIGCSVPIGWHIIWSLKTYLTWFGYTDCCSSALICDVFCGSSPACHAFSMLLESVKMSLSPNYLFKCLHVS